MNSNLFEDRDHLLYHPTIMVMIAQDRYDWQLHDPKVLCKGQDLVGLSRRRQIPAEDEDISLPISLLKEFPKSSPARGIVVKISNRSEADLTPSIHLSHTTSLVPNLTLSDRYYDRSGLHRSYRLAPRVPKPPFIHIDRKGETREECALTNLGITLLPDLLIGALIQLFPQPLRDPTTVSGIDVVVEVDLREEETPVLA